MTNIFPIEQGSNFKVLGLEAKVVDKVIDELKKKKSLL
jgi:hypothetical protein